MTIANQVHEHFRIVAKAKAFRKGSAQFDEWASGYGVITHDALTQVRIYEMVSLLCETGAISDPSVAYTRLKAADRIASAAMWLVVHMTYADKVFFDGRSLSANDLKKDPQGHTGGALNMAIAYVGYLAANALSGETRSWLMGQGHCVAAIDAVNLLMGNMTSEQSARYEISDDGATAFVRDFYACEVAADGHPVSPLGSHVNPHTGGGLIEGGYLGFAELLYPHMPLPGERLVAFLSDGAFEEQRGSDWTPQWWRAEDSGLVAPIMIANGRRIDQRSSMAQSGGVDWFRDHLRLNGFDPIDFNGRDPAAFAWAIYEIEERLSACAAACQQGVGTYPIPLHYGIGETEKGYGFPGAGSNNAHNLPLGANPSIDAQARHTFNDGAAQLFVPKPELEASIFCLNTHSAQSRPKERDHPIAQRVVPAPHLPEPGWKDIDAQPHSSPMAGIDQYFCEIVSANPDLRPRVGNPDEMRSNQLGRSLDLLKHRVTNPEPGLSESTDGKVITALNEEAVVCAALGNKGGINLVCSYEAFAVKMLGAIRQDLIFARNQRLAGQSPNWLGIPILLTSHTWENGKNEQSHQDPTLCEAMLGEMSDTSRVLFPADWNSAQAALRAVYADRGAIWSLVVPKRPQENLFSDIQANQLIADGAVRLKGGDNPNEKIILVATGAYQLAEILKASRRLEDCDISHTVVYLQEPGRFRFARDSMEGEKVAHPNLIKTLFPASAKTRIFLTHTRPEPYQGIVRPLDTGPLNTHVLGYANRGGTLDTNGLLFANKCTWAHALEKVAIAQKFKLRELLATPEFNALQGKGPPSALWSGIGGSR